MCVRQSNKGHAQQLNVNNRLPEYYFFNAMNATGRGNFIDLKEWARKMHPMLKIDSRFTCGS